jgi:hypothetical protein
MVWVLKGFKPFGKNSLNLPNIFLDILFNTVNLDWLTCIPNFEVSLQLANGLNRKIQKEFKFEFETHLNQGCYTPPSLKKCRLEIMKEERFLGKERTVKGPLLWSLRHEGRRYHFLNSMVGNMPTISQELADRNKHLCGVSFDSHYSAKRMKKVFEPTCKTTRTWIYNNQDSRSSLG